MPKRGVLVEACVDSVESAIAAEAGGARRIELCDNLLEGGTTPSAGTIAECHRRLDIPIFVMVRPRGGDFLYTEAEFQVMRRDVVQAKLLGADGVVFGQLTRDGRVDVARTRELVRLARPLGVTFHRAIDVCRDSLQALDHLMALGVDRVLTSGRAETAGEGREMIAALVARADGRLTVMAGCGIGERNVRTLVRRTGVSEVHVRGTSFNTSGMRYRNPKISFRPSGASDFRSEVTDAKKIRRIVNNLNGKTH